MADERARAARAAAAADEEFCGVPERGQGGVHHVRARRPSFNFHLVRVAVRSYAVVASVVPTRRGSRAGFDKDDSGS